MKLSEKSRKILRAVYRGLGVTAVTFVFHSCDGISTSQSAAYGMPPDRPEREELAIRGLVISEETKEPIPGIGIWIKDVTTQYAELTDSRGEFYFYVPKQENYTIIFTDIDGDENGGDYEQHTETITREKAESLAEKQLIIFLKKATEEAETDAE